MRSARLHPFGEEHFLPAPFIILQAQSCIKMFLKVLNFSASFLRDNGCAHTGGDAGFELHDYLIGEELRKVGEGVERSSGLNFSQTIGKRSKDKPIIPAPLMVLGAKPSTASSPPHSTR